MDIQNSNEFDNGLEDYEGQQVRYWHNLKSMLELYCQDYGASVTEIAEGLCISRQRLYDFLKKPEEGLAVNWSTLMNLWKKIAQPKNEILKKLKSEYKTNRESLMKLGPDSLLSTVGFSAKIQPDINNDARKDSLEIKNLQVRRAIMRLTSDWVQDDIVRTYIANEIIDSVLTKGRPDQSFYVELLSDSEKIKNWPREAPISSRHSESLIKYSEEIQKLTSFGKKEFVPSELYEIYQSIYEHEALNSRIPNHINIIDCQFRILSNSIGNIDDETSSQFIKAEEAMLSFLRGDGSHTGSSTKNNGNKSRPRLINFNLNPVIEVAVKVNFSYGEREHPDIIWRYSSTAPHIRNMFSAVKNGLGYPFHIIDFSNRQIGRLERSLVRSEVVLADPEQKEKIYQGWWVEYSTIIGCLHATVDAVKRWLNDQNIDILRYYESFQKLAEIDEQLFISRASFYSHIPDLNYKIADGCVEDIQHVKKQFSQEEREDRYFQRHIELLTQKAQIARLTQMHIALLEGDTKRASTFVFEAEEIALRVHEGPLALNASSCVMFYKLMIGEFSFLTEKAWRKGAAYSLESNADKLGRYIKANCCIDIDAYLYASQFWGTVSYLEFYTASDLKDIYYLNEAANNFLAAAYYACRIDHMKRAIHWLAYASRTYCRLGNIERAAYYADLAQRESDIRSSLTQLGDVEPLMTYSAFADKVYDVGFDLTRNSDNWMESVTRHEHWAMSNLYLAQGEIAFYLGDYEKAASDFSRSLEISIYTGFARLAADSLYNLSRVAEKFLSTTENPFIRQYTNYDAWTRNSFTEDLYKFVKGLGKDINWHQASIGMAEYSALIWDRWSLTATKNSKDRHPFSISIENKAFIKLIQDRL
ncbi:hypothetical protein [Nodosilinea nodulosa]|uniref:hypothetical protein n=1 Tax=Nodosilinea nodulosa TaxID=416001 RepID=UPI0002E91497|nr:hypothetical protein [Nodosilinea nodulosa]